MRLNHVTSNCLRRAYTERGILGPFLSLFLLFPDAFLFAYSRACSCASGLAEIAKPDMGNFCNRSWAITIIPECIELRWLPRRRYRDQPWTLMFVVANVQCDGEIRDFNIDLDESRS
jgi:hypothetical protein